mgnify:CR=1 FL=1
MKRILLYTGYQQTPFDSNTEIGLGGTEQAAIHVSKELVKFGYKVVVSGQVLNSGIIDGVEWIDTINLHKKYHDQFDVIIGISYIHKWTEEHGKAKALNYTKALWRMWYLLLTKYRNYEVFFISVPPMGYLLNIILFPTFIF